MYKTNNLRYAITSPNLLVLLKNEIRVIFSFEKKKIC